MLEQVRHVLQDHFKNLDPPTTYQLMLQHGRIDVITLSLLLLLLLLLLGAV